MSILDFPERGPWGDARWHGNCSGYVYKELYERLRPRLVIDPMCGSDTAGDVARALGIRVLSYDLHSGFNILRESLLARAGEPGDLVLAHPPYGSAVTYSGVVWGQAHPDDLSRCSSPDDFHEKMHAALLNMREATRCGGVYGAILGDQRKDGRYICYSAEQISRMPATELLAVLIKVQHATRTQQKQYRAMAMPRIGHEYVVLWKRAAGSTYHLLGQMARHQGAALQGTWRAIVRNVLLALGGQAQLADIYERVALGAPQRVRDSPHWKAKVRQLLNSSGDYVSPARGTWALA